KFEENESLEEAVVREWGEELGIDVVAGRYRGSWWGLRPWLRYRINVIEVRTVAPLPAVLESNAHDAITWFGPTDDVDAFSWLGPDRDVVQTLVPRS
ncbi:MAG: NUDIX domain-containing protein, partial [Candidatus Thermoplasmatota archaeon]|nr:NUDIX domain-containing protein [Candidatus Thermoplasmatota archaeon]